MPLTLAVRATDSARVLCPSCLNLAPASSLTLDGERVMVRCEHCEATHTLGTVTRPGLRLIPPPVRPVIAEPPPPAPTQVDVTVPASHCPKCVAPRGKAAACAQCGLDFARGKAPELPAWLVTEWSRVTKDWRALDRHQRLLEQAAQTEALWAIGRLYRLWLVTHPDDPVAVQACAEVVLRASGDLKPAEREPTRQLRERRRALAVFVLASFLVVVTLVTVMNLY